LKIVYFSHLYDIKGISAGSANKALGFLEGLRRRGHDVRLYWRAPQPEAFEGGSLRLKVRGALKRRLSRILHDPKALASNLWSYFGDLRILRRERPDVLFLRNELYNVSSQLAARRLGIPVVIEADCPAAYEHRHLSSFEHATPPVLPEWVERWNLGRCGAVITISEVLKGHLLGYGVPEAKITVVPNGADPSVFRPLPGGAAVRARLGIPPGAVTVGWMQSGWGLSGVRTWVDVIRRVLSERPDTAFVFIGGGKNREAIERATPGEWLGRNVFCTGTLPWEEVPRHLAALDIVAVTYPKRELWYPSSMKLFECMAAGRAMVASAVPQVDRVIEEGRNGLLFEPENIEDFGRQILRLAASPALRARLGRRARVTVLEGYTWDIQAGRMEAVLSRAAASGSGLDPVRRGFSVS
jgi:glycosyltransferase involved in cell wall biosynthesis